MQKDKKIQWGAVKVAVAALCFGLGGYSGSYASSDADWPSTGNGYDEQHFSPLDQIDDLNVQEIKLDWELELFDASSLVSTPLAVEGVLYFTADRAIVKAVDAKSGQLLWSYDPETYLYDPRSMATGWNTNRGVAYANGRIFFGALDGRLIALDAESGNQIWETQTFEGSETEARAITGTPRTFGDIVVVGFGGAEYGARGAVAAYSVASGELLWRFFTVPGDPSKKDGAASDDVMPMATETWAGEWWTMGGGGTVWDAITYDEELDQLYIGTSNGGPWNYQLRSESTGDNLFIASIVALNPHTGKYLWHYQANPGERWDYKSTQNMVITNLEIDGEDKKVLLQAHSNGFFYVIDRQTGKLLSAENFSKATWASGVDIETGRPIMTAAADYDETGGSVLYPSNYGAHNWQPMAYSPKTGLAYIPEMQLAAEYRPGGSIPSRDDFIKLGTASSFAELEPRDGKGSLVAWDPATQTEKWKVPFESFWNGGVLATGGNLVFQGTGDGKFSAFNATTGESLWEVDVQRGITAAPITYSVDGVQHVAILVGYGGLSTFAPALVKHGYKYKDEGIRLLSFSLQGEETLQHLTTRTARFDPVDPGPEPINAALAQRGNELYHMASCAVCHGIALSAGSIAPDLRESSAAQSYQTVRPIVKDGSLALNGMPRFEDLSDDEIQSIVAYIRQQTSMSREAKGNVLQ